MSLKIAAALSLLFVVTLVNWDELHHTLFGWQYSAVRGSDLQWERGYHKEKVARLRWETGE